MVWAVIFLVSLVVGVVVFSAARVLARWRGILLALPVLGLVGCDGRAAGALVTLALVVVIGCAFLVLDHLAERRSQWPGPMVLVLCGLATLHAGCAAREGPPPSAGAVLGAARGAVRAFCSAFTAVDRAIPEGDAVAPSSGGAADGDGGAQ